MLSRKNRNNFLNDDDGFSTRDFLMLLFCTAFVVMVIIAFFRSLMGELSNNTIEVINILDNVVITVVMGVFGVQGVKEFKKTKSKDNYSELP